MTVPNLITTRYRITSRSNFRPQDGLSHAVKDELTKDEVAAIAGDGSKRNIPPHDEHATTAEGAYPLPLLCGEFILEDLPWKALQEARRCLRSPAWARIHRLFVLLLRFVLKQEPAYLNGNLRAPARLCCCRCALSVAAASSPEHPVQLLTCPPAAAAADLSARQAATIIHMLVSVVRAELRDTRLGREKFCILEPFILHCVSFSHQAAQCSSAGGGE